MAPRTKGAAGWVAAQARMSFKVKNGSTRLRVHESCKLETDEVLGLSALDVAQCARCKLPIDGPAIMVQVYRGVPAQPRPTDP